MVPFVRTEEELIRVIHLMASHGLHRGDGATAHGRADDAVAAASNGSAGRGLRIHMMCEIPSNALLAKRFLRHCDGFSIGALHVSRTHALLHAV
jgi:pyruvate,water dikinase